MLYLNILFMRKSTKTPLHFAFDASPGIHIQLILFPMLVDEAQTLIPELYLLL